MEVIGQMGIDPSSGGGGGVAQGLSDVKKGRSLGGSHCGEGMAQAVEGEGRKSIVVDEVGEGGGQQIGRNGPAPAVQDNEFVVLPGGRCRPELLGLDFPLPEQEGVDLFLHVKDPGGGAVFGVLFHDGGSSRGTGGPNVDPALLKIYTGPP